jgi:hypothetical protein
MASSFPGAIDSFTDPLSGSPLNSPSHSAQHADLNDAVEKIETYMGLVKVIPTGATNGTVGATGTVTVGSAVSSVTVSGAFSSLYDNYRISMSGGVGSTPAALTFKLGASSTGYYFSGLSVLYSADTLGYSRTNNGSTWDIVGGSYVDGARLEVDLVNPFVSARKTGLYMYGLIDYRTAGSSRVGGAGFHDVADSYTGFTIGVGAGTLTGGSIRVYGYRN